MLVIRMRLRLLLLLHVRLLNHSTDDNATLARGLQFSLHYHNVQHDRTSSSSSVAATGKVGRNAPDEVNKRAEVKLLVESRAGLLAPTESAAAP